MLECSCSHRPLSLDHLARRDNWDWKVGCCPNMRLRVSPMVNGALGITTVAISLSLADLNFTNKCLGTPWFSCAFLDQLAPSTSPACRSSRLPLPSMAQTQYPSNHHSAAVTCRWYIIHLPFPFFCQHINLFFATWKVWLQCLRRCPWNVGSLFHGQYCSNMFPTLQSDHLASTSCL